MNSNTPNLSAAHLLICRTDNIGDVMLTLPLAGYLKQRFPNMRISFLVRSYAAPAVRLCAAVDQVIESDKITDMTAEFKRLQVDVIIFGKPERKLAFAAKRAAIPLRVGTSHRWYHWLSCNRLAHFSRVKSELHEAQLNFLLLAPLGIKLQPALAELPPLYRMHRQQWNREPALAPGQFHLVCHAKSNGNGREWPIAHFTQLCQLLQDTPDVRIYFTGTAKEGDWLRDNAAALLALPNVVNVCGRFDLGQLAAFMGAVDGVVANSTGPLHLSASLGQRTLGLFPPLKPMDPGRWGAVGERAQSLCMPAQCGACEDAQACQCMINIRAEQVKQVVLQWRQQKADATAQTGA